MLDDIVENEYIVKTDDLVVSGYMVNFGPKIATPPDCKRNEAQR